MSLIYKIPTIFIFFYMLLGGPFAALATECSSFINSVHSLRETQNFLQCRGKKSNLDQDELKNIMKTLLSDPLLVHANPGEECYVRAQYVSYLLDRLGFRSKKIHISGNLMVPYKTELGYTVQNYSDHIANVVETMDDHGQKTQWVLDPMFSDHPLKVDEYLKFVDSAKQHKLESEFLSQDYDTPASSAQSVKLAVKESAEVNSCKYNTIFLMMQKDTLQKSQQLSRSVDEQTRAHFPTIDRAVKAYSYFKFQDDSELQCPQSKQDWDDYLMTVEKIPERLRKDRIQSVQEILSTKCENRSLFEMPKH